MASAKCWAAGLALALAIAAPLSAGSRKLLPTRSRSISARWSRASPNGSRRCGPTRKRQASHATHSMQHQRSEAQLVAAASRSAGPAAPGGPPLPKALAPKPNHQPEFDTPANYFKEGTLKALAATGRGKVAQLKPTLGAMQQQYGVPASIIVAIWGRETGFGKVDAPYDASPTIATQAFMGRRPDEFRQQLIAAMKILQEGHASRSQLAKLMGGRHGLYPIHAQRISRITPSISTVTASAISGTRSRTRSPRPAIRCRAKAGMVSRAGATKSRLPKDFDCTLQGPDKARPICRMGEARRGPRVKGSVPEGQTRAIRLPRSAGGTERTGIPRHQ